MFSTHDATLIKMDKQCLDSEAPIADPIGVPSSSASALLTFTPTGKKVIIKGRTF